jgi:hypothetical protein
MSKSKNDLAWEKIFEKHKIIERILNEGRIEISATKINEFREARLIELFQHDNQSVV